MSILEKIVKAKRADVEKLKISKPITSLEKSKFFEVKTISLENSLTDKDGYGVIAEFKRQSPSRGIINPAALVEDVCKAYFNSGASAVSVLTNNEFFGGSSEDLISARKICFGPILRKEFIIDEYQVIESKSLGADAILLIVDILTVSELRKLSELAASLNMDVLFEIHDNSGITKLPGEAKLIGINSRNLGNFRIDMDILKKTITKLPESGIKIAESGIHSAEILTELRRLGFNGFLVGELFMRETDPGKACYEFISKIKKLK